MVKKNSSDKGSEAIQLPGLAYSGSPYGDTVSGNKSPWLGISKKNHMGIDEAGRGCMAGPVVAASLCVPSGVDPAILFPGLTDSKKLSSKKREKLVADIYASGLCYGVGLSWPDEIDRINILNATFRAMSRAVFACMEKLSGNFSQGNMESVPLLVDGSQAIRFQQWEGAWMNENSMTSHEVLHNESLSMPAMSMRPRAKCPALPKLLTVVDGDSLVPSISAASVIAKTTRDSLMCKLAKQYPEYGFEKHKGYGTAAHFEAIKRFGLSWLHRKSFSLKKCDQASLF